MEPIFLLLCGDSSIMFCCDRRITRISITIYHLFCVCICPESSGRNMIPIYTAPRGAECYTIESNSFCRRHSLSSLIKIRSTSGHTSLHFSLYAFSRSTPYATLLPMLIEDYTRYTVSPSVSAENHDVRYYD